MIVPGVGAGVVEGMTGTHTGAAVTPAGGSVLHVGEGGRSGDGGSVGTKQWGVLPVCLHFEGLRVGLHLEGLLVGLLMGAFEHNFEGHFVGLRVGFMLGINGSDLMGGDVGQE